MRAMHPAERRRHKWVVITALGFAALVARAAGGVDGERGASQTTPTPTIGIVRGIVTDFTSGTPLRKAIVTLRGPGLPPTRSSITDDEGRFAFSAVRAGRYSVISTKAAYLNAAYGATRPGRRGTPLQLDGGATADITIRMARGAVIEGVIRDDSGRPIANLPVYAMEPMHPASVFGTYIEDSTKNDVLRSMTDDRGMYRLFGLPPGEYVIASLIRPSGGGEVRRQTASSVDDALRRLQSHGPASTGIARGDISPSAELVGYAPIYYPGVTAFARAERVRLYVGAERAGLDFTVGPVRTSAIEGTVLPAGGQALGNVQLSMVIDGMIVADATSRPTLVMPPGPDGRFRYRGVPSGHYRIIARVDAATIASTLPADGRGGGIAVNVPVGRSFAMAEVDVFGQDVTGVQLTLRPGVRLAARAAFDAATATPPKDLSTLRVGLTSAEGREYSVSSGGTRFGTVIISPPSARVSSDGLISMADIAPGSYRLAASLPSDTGRTWWLRSAIVGGRDLLDDGVTVDTTDIEGVVLTFTDRRNEVTGVLLSATGTPASGYFIAIFPSDRALWREGSRRLAFTRPGTDGRFSIADVPAGSYLLAALTDFDMSDFADRAVLEQMAATAIPIAVRDGERTVQDVQIGR